jgi:purine nucleosidase
MTARQIIIDTDPGLDDAVAILLALASPEEVEVLGIAAVAGNLPLAVCERNARRVCELAGRREVPVFAGCARPVMRPLSTKEDLHGESPEDRLTLPEPVAPLQPRHGVDFIVETLRAAPAGSITLCALGPLTNVATALVMAPDIAPRIAEIVVMGGSVFVGGNVTPVAEFNIATDPHAARIVFESGVPIVLFPLDATHQVLSTEPRIAALAVLGNKSGAAVASMLSLYGKRRSARFPEGGPLHDPTVIAWLLEPGLFAGRRVNLSVETESPLTAGMTVADWWGVTGRPANALVINEADGAGFYALLTERLRRLP